MLEDKNFDLVFIKLKLGEFLFFDNSFFDLANFQNLDNFLSFKFFDLDKF